MYIETTNTTEIVARIRASYPDGVALLLVAETDKPDIPELIMRLNDANVKFLGGIFPKLIFDGTVKEKGTIVYSIPDNKVVHQFKVENLEEKNYEIPQTDLTKDKTYCMFTLVDGLAGNISNYLSELYRNFGNYCSYLGGGSGSLTLQQQPCVFDSNGFDMNAAVGIIFETKLNIGVKHGLKKLRGPIIATKTDKNVIQELNWRNALEVYKEVVEPDAKIELTEENFFSIAKAYTFGMIKENAERIVRSPIGTNDKGEIICVGEVLENTVIDILKSQEENLISSATEAASLAIKETDHVKSVLIVDCISRVLFLEDNFQKELDNVSLIIKKRYDKANILGALTIGEISSYNGYLEFLNKTLVVGLFS